jgi:ABC-2 type transport system ATP-binding protein
MHDAAVVVDQLYKTYDSFVAVDRISFEVRRGEIFGLLGPNGAGKTTTIRMLMDIFKPDGGAVTVLGRAPGAVRERVGYLPEERGLYRGLRVDECLTYLGQLKGMTRAAAHKRGLEWLERVELKEWARKKVQELSRGMQQKVQLVASLIHDPDLVVLDEPFQGLDPVNVEMIKGVVRDLRAQGKAIMLSAHEMSLVETLCERIALIDHGKLLLYGELSEIKKRFAPNAMEIHPPLALEGWSEVERTELRDGKQLIYLHASTSPREFLKTLLDRGLWVEQFEIASVPLDQIFVAVVTGNQGPRHD